ncbi:MAG: dihydroorotate dehydrogenase (quinone), partial [Mesorhizobium sp.]
AGPALPGRIVAGMAQFADRERLQSIGELRDTACANWYKRL